MAICIERMVCGIIVRKRQEHTFGELAYVLNNVNEIPLETALISNQSCKVSVDLCQVTCPIFVLRCINNFPHIYALWRFCSRRLFENIVTTEEIAQNVQYLLLPQCFPLLVMGYRFNYRDFLLVDKICSKSSAAKLSYEGKG